MSNKIRKKIKRRNKMTSGLHDHKRKGKHLAPPFATMPKMVLTSWMNDRLPEMVWAALLFTHLGRDDAFEVLREVGRFLHKNKEEEVFDITLTGISKFPEKLQSELLKIITSKPKYIEALLPLLIFENLPAREQWIKALKTDQFPENIDHLLEAVANTLDHQSETSTDCRWLRVFCQLQAGKLHLPDVELIKEIYYFPKFGNMKKVRPSIRATEGSFDMLQESKPIWPKLFWEECLSKTPCMSFPKYAEKDISETMPVESVVEIYLSLIELAHDSSTTTAINPEHDTIFGTILFCTRMLIETLENNARFSMSGRLALRAIVESYITLSYLVKKNDPDLWESHRVYGAGQAKLSMLKVEDLEEIPKFIDIKTLTNLANEDVWQEFLTINLAHWNKSNLRQLSEKSGTKKEYDKYYSWTSSYTHGQWGAIRDSVFETCGNPLHRLHRIPSLELKKLPCVISDMTYLINKMLKIISTIYPDFKETLQTTD